MHQVHSRCEQFVESMPSDRWVDVRRRPKASPCLTSMGFVRKSDAANAFDICDRLPTIPLSSSPPPPPSGCPEDIRRLHGLAKPGVRPPMAATAFLGVPALRSNDESIPPAGFITLPRARRGEDPGEKHWAADIQDKTRRTHCTKRAMLHKGTDRDQPDTAVSAEQGRRDFAGPSR